MYQTLSSLCGRRLGTRLVGDRVFLYTPSERAGQAYKLARPFKGPYHVVAIDNNVVDIRRISRPESTAVQVAVSRLRHCPAEMEFRESQTTEEMLPDHGMDMNEGYKVQHQTEHPIQRLLPAEGMKEMIVMSQPNVWMNRLQKWKSHGQHDHSGSL